MVEDAAKLLADVEAGNPFWKQEDRPDLNELYKSLTNGDLKFNPFIRFVDGKMEFREDGTLEEMLVRVYR